MGTMRKSRSSKHKQDRPVEHFMAGTTAGCAASLIGVNVKTSACYFHRLHETIACQPEQEVDAPGSATAAGKFAKDALVYMAALCKTEILELDIRIGLHTGPVVAGVIGQSKYSYDIWGDAVNIAARLQQTAQPGKILLSKETGDLLPNDFKMLPQGETPLKGHTPVETFVLQPKN